MYPPRGNACTIPPPPFPLALFVAATATAKPIAYPCHRNHRHSLAFDRFRKDRLGACYSEPLRQAFCHRMMAACRLSKDPPFHFLCHGMPPL